MVGITGIGSGVDINSIVGAMVNAEKAPKEAQLARLEKASTTKLSSLGQLKGALGEFQTAMKDLNSLALFEKRTATSSNTSALTAVASKTAVAGSFQATVERLASGSKVASAAVNNTFNSGLAGESFSVKLGASDAATVVNIMAGSDLSSTRDQLNAALKDKGISVNIVNNPNSPAGESRLVFSAKATGTGKDVIVSGSGNLDALKVDGTVALDTTDTASAGYITKAADAEFTIDGLALKSPSNTVDAAIPGVTLTLVGKTEVGKPLTLSMGQDTEDVTAKIKKFVESYNKLVTTSSQLTNVTKVGEGKPPVVGGLVGDATVRTLLGGVRNELATPAGQVGVRVLADLGLSTQKDGTLKIDDAKLSKALTDNFDAVGSFFTGDSGLMSRVDRRIKGYSQVGGVLEQRMKGLQSTISDIDKQKGALTRRIEQLQTRLFAQFNAMDSLVGRLNDTSARLGQALGSLPGVVE